jgi:hypothetical protein
MNNPNSVEKVRLGKIGLKVLKKNGIRKMAKPGTDKYNSLISEGFC